MGIPPIFEQFPYVQEWYLSPATILDPGNDYGSGEDGENCEGGNNQGEGSENNMADLYQSRQHTLQWLPLCQTKIQVIFDDRLYQKEWLPGPEESEAFGFLTSRDPSIWGSSKTAVREISPLSIGASTTTRVLMERRRMCECTGQHVWRQWWQATSKTCFLVKPSREKGKAKKQEARKPEETPSGGQWNGSQISRAVRSRCTRRRSCWPKNFGYTSRGRGGCA